MRAITLTEYQTLEKAEAPVLDDEDQSKRLGAECFDQLLEKLTGNINNTSEQRFFKVIPSRTTRGFALQANNYVGFYKISDRSALEILPKIYSETDLSLEEQRRLLLKLLAAIYDLKVTDIENVNLGQLANVPLLEIFITLFLKQVEYLCNRGLRADYQDLEENEPFLRGRLLIKDNLRLNMFNHARFYCKYQIFSENRPENRLLLSALLKVSALSSSQENIRLSAKLLPNFSQVAESTNFYHDMQQWQRGPEMAAYQQLESWCQLLLNCHPTLSSGELSANSIMFPMERLFEAYVQATFKRTFNVGAHRVFDNSELSNTTTYLASWQNNERPLDENVDVFVLKPDILVKNEEQTVMILDAKWKLLDENERRLNIKESDVYQMLAYAYAFKPVSGNLFLIFPKFERFQQPVMFKFNNSADQPEYRVRVIPFDLATDEFIGITDWRELVAPEH